MKEEVNTQFSFRDSLVIRHKIKLEIDIYSKVTNKSIYHDRLKSLH